MREEEKSRSGSFRSLTIDQLLPPTIPTNGAEEVKGTSYYTRIPLSKLLAESQGYLGSCEQVEKFASHSSERIGRTLELELCRAAWNWYEGLRKLESLVSLSHPHSMSSIVPVVSSLRPRTASLNLSGQLCGKGGLSETI